MKNRLLAYLIALSIVVTPAMAQPPVSADDADVVAMKAQSTEKQQAMLAAPAGVFDIEYENGTLKRLKIKGEAEVSPTLKGVRADRQARERAERNAKAAFSKFLNENIVVVESDSETFIIKEKDGTESAEYLSASAKSINTLSNSFQRGLVTLLDHVEGVDANRKAVVILGWSQKLTEAAIQAQNVMQPEPATSGQKTGQTSDGNEARSTIGPQTRMGDVDNF